MSDFSDGAVRVIGSLEILAAIALIVPPLVGAAPVLTPIAAVGLGGLMIGAAVTHRRRNEPQMMVVNVLLLILAGVVAWGRFGAEAF